MNPPALPPAGRWPAFAFRLLLVAVLMALLIQANRHYFFQSTLYEASDAAANSLSVLRAGHFQELHGNYSRWQFHHPGPAMFYGEAAAEGTLYRWLHLVPTPYNAQLLFTLLLAASFFAVGISVATRWMRSGLFVALVLAFAVLHFTGAGAEKLLLENWPPFTIPLVLFALLVTAASVGAGQGDDLPLLALAGCFLLHLHVAQPLFVAPMFLLAYVGLAWSCWRRRTLPAVPLVPAPSLVAAEPSSPPATVVPTTPAAPLPGRSALPWRVYRGAHRLALLIALLFALPLLVDLLSGSRSNFHQIVEHVRTHRGDHHTLLASVGYLLDFAVYRPSLPTTSDRYFPLSSWHDLVRFLVRHPEMMLAWLFALLSPLLPLAVRVWHGQDAPLLGSPMVATAAYQSPPGRWRFLGWLWVVWLASIGLTLYWGQIQDGDMYYFNAWFNYSIWFVLALLAAGALADALAAVLVRAERPLVWKTLVVALCAVAAVLTCTRHPASFRTTLYDTGENRAQERVVVAALENEPAGTARPKLLLFPHDAWDVATGIAVTLTRRGREADVLPYWGFMFGQNHVLPGWENYVTNPVETNPPFEVWHLVPRTVAPAAYAEFPLLHDYALVRGGLPVDPNPEFRLTTTGEKPNYQEYFLSGWTSAEGFGGSWTREKTSWIQFKPLPVPAGQDVSVTFDYAPYLVKGKRESQRIEAYFNGLSLGSLQVAAEEGGPNRFTIPAATWNKYATALLVLKFPDAITPREAVGENSDDLLAFKVRSITFSTAQPGNPAPPSTPSPEPSPSVDLAPVPVPSPILTPEPSPEPTPENTSTSPAPEPMASPEMENTPTPTPEPTAEPMFTPEPASPSPEPGAEPTPTSMPTPAAEPVG